MDSGEHYNIIDTWSHYDSLHRAFGKSKKILQIFPVYESLAGFPDPGTVKLCAELGPVNGVDTLYYMSTDDIAKYNLKPWVVEHAQTKKPTKYLTEHEQCKAFILEKQVYVLTPETVVRRFNIGSIDLLRVGLLPESFDTILLFEKEFLKNPKLFPKVLVYREFESNAKKSAAFCKRMQGYGYTVVRSDHYKVLQKEDMPQLLKFLNKRFRAKDDAEYMTTVSH